MKITIREEPGKLCLKVEGRVSGPWAEEFERTWQSLAPSLEEKKLVVDLCGVIHMDGQARRVLSEIYRQTGAEIVADSPMTKYFAEEARRDGNRTGPETERKKEE